MSTVPIPTPDFPDPPRASPAFTGPLGDIYVPGSDWPVTDDQPMETEWQVFEIPILINSLYQLWGNQKEFHASGNMFIHYDPDQLRHRKFLGPDFFLALGVPTRLRKYWAVWEEGGKFPDLIIELLSHSTRKADLTNKKQIYEKIFRTPDYICFDPDSLELMGWRLEGGVYQPLQPNEKGWLWSEAAGLWVGPWQGTVLNRPAIWLRFFTAQGELVLTPNEASRLLAETAQQSLEAERQRAEIEKQRADSEKQIAQSERQRADTLAAELAALKARLGSSPDIPETLE